jgi:FkbH-like protein
MRTVTTYVDGFERVTAMSVDVRTEIELALGAEDWLLAHARLQQLWASQRSGAVANFVMACANRLQPHVALKSLRVFALRSFTIEPVLKSLAASSFMAGIDLTTGVGDFNSYPQEILDPNSSLYQFDPNAVFLCVQTRDIVPQLWSGYAELNRHQVQEMVANTIAEFSTWFEVFRKHSNASLIVHLLEKPLMPSQGVLDAQTDSGQFATVDEINRGIRKSARLFAGIHLLDYDSLIARHGRATWHDEVKWRVSRMPIAARHLSDLADEWLRFICALSGQVCKVVVTDLDNTLWGGTAGEDGLEGIKLGQEHPGFQFLEVQRALLDLYRRGILLAIASKNNPADAMRILESHPEMLLRPEHFAAIRINWNDKGQSLQEIASELNLGIDSLAFLDDNPAEREQVRLSLPEVKVLDLSAEPGTYAQRVRDCPYFERLTLTADDRHRNEQYVEQRMRGDLQRASPSIEEYYKALQQRVEIARADASTFSRIAQLTAKTNQFNMTTKRYTEQEIREFSGRSCWAVHSIRVIDRFGDNGVVGVLITKDRGNECQVDTFLLSCRVIGRTIETAVLSFLVEECRMRGLSRISGRFTPSKKNAPAADFYSRHGFEKAEPQGEDSFWTLDVQRETVKTPAWISIVTGQGEISEYAAS